KECFEKAVGLNPYHGASNYGLAMLLRAKDPTRAKALLENFVALQKAGVEEITKIRYTEQGRYAEVIGRPEGKAAPTSGPPPLLVPEEKFHVELAPGARWATSADFGEGDAAYARRLVRGRFGGALAVLDY